jgi:ribosomal protein L29
MKRAFIGSLWMARRMASRKEELFGLRFQSATGQLENTARLREVRKDIARVYTVLQVSDTTSPSRTLRRVVRSAVFSLMLRPP